MKEKIVRLTVCLALSVICLILGAVLGLVWSLPDLEQWTEQDLCLEDDGHIVCDKSNKRMDGFLKKKLGKLYDDYHVRLLEDVEKSIEEKGIQLRHTITDYGLDLRPSGKMEGRAVNRDKMLSPGEKNMTTVCEWLSGADQNLAQGFLRYGVTYHKGRMVVPASGLYVIYSNLELYENCDPSTGFPLTENNSTNILHSLYKYSVIDGEKEIVCNEHARKRSPNGYYNYYNSYVSTLVRLTAGDEVYVKSNNISMLRYPDSNYFGLNYLARNPTSTSSW